VLVGDGPLGPQLRQEQATRRLTNLEIRPSIPISEVGRFMQECDALLVPLSNHPRLADFIPSKLYDGMAVGRPAIVATRGEAAAVISEARGGLVVPPEDGAALADAIRQLAGDPELVRRLGAAGRAAARHLRRSRQVDQLESILTEAAASSTAGRHPKLAGRCAGS
jgi:colanic acid biosynthesis glycosyl transferase WcaI